jgi:hypothetical protein
MSQNDSFLTLEATDVKSSTPIIVTDIDFKRRLAEMAACRIGQLYGQVLLRIKSVSLQSGMPLNRFVFC